MSVTVAGPVEVFAVAVVAVVDQAELVAVAAVVADVDDLAVVFDPAASRISGRQWCDTQG